MPEIDTRSTIMVFGVAASVLGVGCSLAWNWYNMRANRELKSEIRKRDIVVREFDRIVTFPINGQLQNLKNSLSDLRVINQISSIEKKTSALDDLNKKIVSEIGILRDECASIDSLKKVDFGFDWENQITPAEDEVLDGFNAMSVLSGDDSSFNRGTQGVRNGIRGLNTTLQMKISNTIESIG